MANSKRVKGDRIKWDATEADRETIAAITHRAERELFGEVKRGERRDRAHECQLSIAACHLNGCPLRLADLLTADAFNFAHDVLGINRHISRDTGKLLNHFLPRFHQK